MDGTGTEKGKGKEKETDDPERQRLGARIAMLKEEIATIVPEFDRDADLTAMLPEERRKLVATVKENGTKLAALYGELMEASRNLVGRRNRMSATFGSMNISSTGWTGLHPSCASRLR